VTTPASGEVEERGPTVSSLVDPTSVEWVSLVPVSEENPFDEGELDEDGLTESEFDMIFRRPAASVPINLIAAVDVTESPREELQSGMPRQLKDYWLRGEGAAQIRWGTKGSFTRCVRELREHFPTGTEGLCANLYHEATGHWPGEDRDK